LNRSVPRTSLEKNIPVESAEHPHEVIEVVVRPGKRLVFSEGRTDAESIGAGSTARGEIDRSGPAPFVVFPKHAGARLKLSTLQDRWDKEIIDVWRLEDGKRTEEFF